MNHDKTRSLFLDDEDSVRQLLLSDTTLKLAEIHRTLLTSQQAMHDQSWTATTAPISHLTALTQFGREVGGDEIHWWIFQKEPDVDQLAARTKSTLDSVQVLKNAASTLKDREPKSYEDLLRSLKEFADVHRAQITALHGYVSWLMERSIMAPIILFSYRVWGSTRRADRMLHLKEEDDRDNATLLTLIEIVLGVRNRDMLVYNKAHFDIGMSIFDSLDPEQIDDEAEIFVPEASVIRRTSYSVYDNCATYFTELRDSLRNILVDTTKFTEQRALFESDEFWQQFLMKARNVKTTETQLWDFKETLALWHVKGERERRDAKVSFAEDVASFANTSGGVLIVGVNDKRGIVGVGAGRELETRLKVALDVVAKHIEYDRELVSFRQLAITESGEEKFCLIVLISQASNPVSVTDGDGHYTYPVRRETGISRVGRDAVRSLHLKGDNRDFMHELRQFIRDG
jgi:hypothetical protein